MDSDDDDDKVCERLRVEVEVKESDRQAIESGFSVDQDGSAAA